MVEAVVEDYEHSGQGTVRALALGDREPDLAEMLAAGAGFHVAWVAEQLAPLLQLRPKIVLKIGEATNDAQAFPAYKPPPITTPPAVGGGGAPTPPATTGGGNTGGLGGLGGGSTGGSTGGTGYTGGGSGGSAGGTPRECR